MGSRNGRSKEYWEARCAEVEASLQDCANAFELIPIWALERGQNWLPSDVAMLLLKKAKDGIRDYMEKHNGNGFH